MISNLYPTSPSPSATIQTSRRAKNLARVYLTLKELERCVAFCEILADELGPESLTDPLHQHINECIVACEQLIGAGIRQSHFAVQYAELCVAACSNLAKGCQHAEARTALQCAEHCRDCIGIIRDEFGVRFAN